MSGEETPDLFRAFGWRILTSLPLLVSLVGAAVLVDTLVLSAVFVAVFVEALVLALAVSTVFVEALVLATVSAAFFFPARGFLVCASAAFWLEVPCPLSVLCLRYTCLTYGLTHQKLSHVIRYR